LIIVYFYIVGFVSNHASVYIFMNIGYMMYAYHQSEGQYVIFGSSLLKIDSHLQL